MSSDQHMKKLVSLRVHVMMRCDMRQHFAPQKMQSESSEYVRKTTGSSQTVGESKWPWRATLKSMRKMLGRQTG